MKHQAVRQLQLVKRSSEEITRLKREMTNCLHYYVDELQQLQAVQSELQVSATSMLKLGCVPHQHADIFFSVKGRLMDFKIHKLD